MPTTKKMTKIKTITKKPTCPSGYILRNAYKTKSGKVIQSRCIHKTGIISPGKSTNKTLKMINNARERSIKALKLSKKLNLPIRSRCDKGQTLRSGYTRRSYDRRQGKSQGLHYRHAIVAPGCIKKEVIKRYLPKQKNKKVKEVV